MGKSRKKRNVKCRKCGCWFAPQQLADHMQTIHKNFRDYSLDSSSVLNWTMQAVQGHPVLSKIVVAQVPTLLVSAIKRTSPPEARKDLPKLEAHVGRPHDDLGPVPDITLSGDIWVPICAATCKRTY